MAVVNPSGTPTSGTLSYQFSDGAPPSSRPFSLGATSRLTVDVNAEVGPGRDVSVSVLVDPGQPGVIAERPTYFSRSIAAAGAVDEGAAAVGVTVPRVRWAFPEGTTRAGFQTYVSLQNPLTATAEVTVDFQRGDGTTTSQSLSVAPGTRVTVDVNAANPGEVDVSSLVRSTNGAPVVAERPVYFRRAIGVAGDVDGGSVAAGIPTG